MPILTASLGVEQYGLLLLMNILVYFGHTVIDYGVQYSGVREVARCRDENQKVKSTYEEHQGVRFLFFFLYVLCVFIYGVFFQSEFFIIYILLGAVPYLVGYTLISAWFFQAIGETIIFAKLMLLSKVINLIVLLFYVKGPEDIYIALLAFSLPMLLSGIVSFYFIYKKYNSKLFSLNNISYRLRTGFDIFIGLLAPNLYNSIPTLILGAVFPIVDFTPFAVASRLSSVISTAQNVIAKSLFPVLVIIKTDQVKKLIIINTIVSLPIIVFVVFFGDEFLNLFLGSEYTNAAKYLIIFSIGLFFVGVSNSIGQGYFLPNKLDDIYRLIAIRVSVFSAFISWLLISYYGVLGGAIAITVARVIFCLDHFVYYKRLT